MLHFVCTSYSYYSTFTTHRFHFAWPRESSHFSRIIHVFVAWPRFLLRFTFMFCRAIRVAFTSRFDIIIMRRSISALIKLCIICYCAVRRGLDRTPGPRPCSFVDSSFFFLSARQPCSLARNPLCCSRLANTIKKANLHSRRLFSTSLGGGVWRVLLGTRHNTSLPGTSHLTSTLSPIYILLLNLFFPRVTQVTSYTSYSNTVVYDIRSYSVYCREIVFYTDEI